MPVRELVRKHRSVVADLAESPAVRDCLQWFAREKQWINERHLELCRIPAPTFQEQERASWFLAQFKALGCETSLDRAGNVIAAPHGQSEATAVALTAHLDTVLSPRTASDISMMPDGRMIGPGVSDNGAGLAALLAIAAVARACAWHEHSDHPLLLIANVGEEGEGNLSGMRYLCKQSPLANRIHAFLVLDGPAVDHITAHALASRRFELAFSGPGGHSWSDYGMGNPVHALSRAVTLFTENRPNGSGWPRTSINFGTIEGGLSINSIPTTARAKLDLRSESPERMEELAAQLTGAVERALEIENERATGSRVTARIREIGSRPGGKLHDDAPILVWLRSIDAYLGIRAHIDCASTDANIPLSLGMQALSIGAGGQGGGAHTPSEWYHPEGRELGLRRILLLLALLMREQS